MNTSKSGSRPIMPPVPPPPHRPRTTAMPPTPPHLRVVPPPVPPPPAWAQKVAPPLPPIDTAALLNDPAVHNAFEGMLTKNTSMLRLFRSVGDAGGQTRARVGRLVEHLRLFYQLKLSVQLEHFRQRRGIDQANLNKWIVTSYKLLGFTVLTVIVVALLSYLGANVFYWFSGSWIEPTVISPTDDRVLQLSAALAQQASTRDKIAADLADADREIAMHVEFLDGAKKALTEELADRKSELSKLVMLHRSFTSTRAEVSSNSRAYTGMSRKRIRAEYGARLIDRESAVTGALQLSQIAQGNLSLAEKSVELDKRTAELSRATDSLASIVESQPATRHSYEVLRILQDLKRAQVELAKARDNRTVLQKSLERYEKMVTTISGSPYLRAVEGKDTIAFVPYDNLSVAKPGAPLYACALGPMFCRRVGTIVALMPGEMSFKHPLHNTQLRGQPVQVQLDVHAAERQVLFAGGRPVLF